MRPLSTLVLLTLLTPYVTSTPPPSSSPSSPDLLEPPLEPTIITAKAVFHPAKPTEPRLFRATYTITTPICPGLHSKTELPSSEDELVKQSQCEAAKVRGGMEKVVIEDCAGSVVEREYGWDLGKVEGRKLRGGKCLRDHPVCIRTYLAPNATGVPGWNMVVKKDGYTVDMDAYDVLWGIVGRGGVDEGICWVERGSGWGGVRKGEDNGRERWMGMGCVIAIGYCIRGVGHL
ncbi:hypothetical protein BJ508DRAFT_377327 [Ascobolus immersus RN42]|uniref:Ecp2 effector protein domain-containing protein n=1 Tax=Ascobolus immersus RN42 TaxID=1160509 RepID=A0A3N4I6X9_ASCIM|nr:hypothetical protein BJ508DRAFT_377327 [Ascobolus immersus RN42]